MRVLFIDFDGVLHPTTTGPGLCQGAVITTPLWGWEPALAKLLEPHSDVGVVVHSSWRYEYDKEELTGLLQALGQRVVGVAPRGPRYESIRWWLYTAPAITSYRILDDDANEFPDPPPPELILCDPSAGVSDPNVQAALRRWLGECCRVSTS